MKRPRTAHELEIEAAAAWPPSPPRALRPGGEAMALLARLRANRPQKLEHRKVGNEG